MYKFCFPFERFCDKTFKNFQQAGSLLDASARIYSFRVDATHSEAYDVRSKLGDSKLILGKLFHMEEVSFQNKIFQNLNQITKVIRKIFHLIKMMME